MSHLSRSYIGTNYFSWCACPVWMVRIRFLDSWLMVASGTTRKYLGSLFAVRCFLSGDWSRLLLESWVTLLPPLMITDRRHRQAPTPTGQPHSATPPPRGTYHQRRSCRPRIRSTGKTNQHGSYSAFSPSRPRPARSTRNQARTKRLPGSTTTVPTATTAAARVSSRL